MSLKRDIEAIYVLEPWYSKMRQELKDEGWVQDNMFWERCKRSLDKLTKRVLPFVSKALLHDIWDVTWLYDDSEFNVVFALGFDYSGMAPYLVFDGFNASDNEDFLERIQKDWRRYVPFYTSRLDLFPTFRQYIKVGKIYKEGKEWRLEQGNALLQLVLKQGRQDRTAARARYVGFPMDNSARIVRRRQFPVLEYWSGGDTYEGNLVKEGNLNLAKASDRLGTAWGQGIPERIMAINLALNTVHRGRRAVALIPGISSSDLDRWSRMGVKSKATAKQYLEHNVQQAVDMLLEGGTRREAVAALM